MKKIILNLLLILVLAGYNKSFAQEKALAPNYVGFIPAFLAEPYDTINALEVNFFPFMYEMRIGKNNDIGLQVRPIVNYRFFKPEPGFSQIGGTVVINKYFLKAFKDDFWLKPQLAIFYSYAYNRLDEFQTMTLGIEPGAYMQISDDFSISVILQPGINYYPDQVSREYVETDSGYKHHFGVFFHIGYNF